MTTAPTHTDPQATAPAGEAASRHRTALYRAGFWIAAAGIGLFLPMLVLAIVSNDWRIVAALSTLGSWVVWKIGRTLMKLNAPPTR